MTGHVPASLHFSGVSYKLNDRLILDNISGSIKSGQVMAIMGVSGAGKSTFLDILARRNKRGEVSGRMLVNGREVTDEEFQKVTGFVDQEDTLMPTLTVYETVLYSALLRLPKDMSFEAKKFRTLETMNELGILGIKDSRIGDTGRVRTVIHPVIIWEMILQAHVLFPVVRSVEYRSPVNLSQAPQSFSWMNPRAVSKSIVNFGTPLWFL